MLGISTTLYKFFCDAMNVAYTSNFMMCQKLEPLFPNISIQRLKIQKRNS